MLKKIKHNKIKNTGLIYQFLLRKIIEQKIDGKKPTAFQIFKNYFNNNKVLGQELAIYNALIKSDFNDISRANILLEQILNIRKNLDDVKLDKEKYFCIKQIKENYNLKQFFSAPISNYKVHASIYKILESSKRAKYDPLQIAESKSQLLDYIIKPKQELQLDEDFQFFKKQTRLQKQKALEMMVDRFNEKYDILNQKQKSVLQKYCYTMSNEQPLLQHIQKQIYKTYHIIHNKDQALVQSLKQNITNLQKIKNTQEKLYILLNLYQIEQALGDKNEQHSN